MRDIICPNCGGRFIGTDTVFDLSEYITSLLCAEHAELESVREVGFKFYADANSIMTHTTDQMAVPLFCESKMGADNMWFPYVVTHRMLFEYVESKIQNRGDLGFFLRELQVMQNERQKNYSPDQIQYVLELYQTFFKAAKNITDFSMDDDNVKTALKILMYLYSKRDSDEEITIGLRIYSSKHNVSRPDYCVPDFLFVNDAGKPKKIQKSCRFCGFHMPLEFGYYKMMPVVLLGSHASGKTSFLLALCNTILTGNGALSELKPETLSDDEFLNAFTKNVDRFRKGLPPNKTDFSDVPVFNVRVQDCIYSFVDWPGEKFIDQSGRASDDYIFNSRRVIRFARHFLCFLEPSQINDRLETGEENVKYEPDALTARFREHIECAGELNRSITFIINKCDMLSGQPNAAKMLELVNCSEDESFVYDAKTGWRNENYRKLESTTREYIKMDNIILYNSLDKVFKQVEYLPVAPYGETPDPEESDKVIYRTRLAGLPLLRILRRDGMTR